MAQTVPASDPRFREAINELRDECGLSVDKVLLPSHWSVVLINGQATVILNEDGMRALALLSDRPGAQQITEELIGEMNRTVRRD